MDISILCSDPKHPVHAWLEEWCEKQRQAHRVELVSQSSELTGGELLFLISCTEYLPASVRESYTHSLVLHASDLPEGRGWSPMVWQILEGRNRVVVSLLEAVDSIDSGDIWQKRTIVFEGHELADELNDALFRTELELMDYAVDNFDTIVPEPQDECKVSYYPRRVPEDSRIDIEKSIASQFDLLRVSDPQRYPSFFEFRGFEYEIQIRKRRKVSDD